MGDSVGTRRRHQHLDAGPQARLAGHETDQGHAIAVQCRQRLEHGDERDAPGLVARDGRLHAHAVLGHDALAVEGGDLLRRLELGQPLLRPQPELELDRGKACLGRAQEGFRLGHRAVAPLPVERQVDGHADLPHRIEAAAVHVAALDAEVGPVLLLRQKDGEACAVERDAGRGPLGAPRGNLGAQRRRRLAADQGRRRCERRLRGTAEEAVDLGHADRRLGGLLGQDLADARQLHLGPQHVLLVRLAHRIPRARDALDLAPDIRLFTGEVLDGARLEQAVVGAPYGGGDAQLRARELLCDLVRLPRSDLAAQAQLAGPGQALPGHEGQVRVHHLPEGRRPAFVRVAEAQPRIGPRGHLGRPLPGGKGELLRDAQVGIGGQRLRDERGQGGVLGRVRVTGGSHGERPGQGAREHDSRDHSDTSAARAAVSGPSAARPRADDGARGADQAPGQRFRCGGSAADDRGRARRRRRGLVARGRRFRRPPPPAAPPARIRRGPASTPGVCRHPRRSRTTPQRRFPPRVGSTRARGRRRPARQAAGWPSRPAPRDGSDASPSAWKHRDTHESSSSFALRRNPATGRRVVRRRSGGA